MPKDRYDLPSRQLVSQQDSAMIERADVPRSKFSGSWTRLTTFDAGLLIPFLVDEILPGDHMKYDVTAYVRMATPLFPLFNNQKIDTHFFFVPNRLVWSQWKKFCGEQDNAGDSIVFTVPQIVSPVGGFAANSVYDQMGLPCAGQITAGQTITINAMPLRAYYLIIQEWFKDQNQYASFRPSTGNGPDLSTAYALFRRAKANDYFVSALPWPQKFAAPTLFPGAVAPVTGIGMSGGLYPDGPINVVETGGGVVNYPIAAFTSNAGPVGWVGRGDAGGTFPAIYADFSAAVGITINAFRQSMMVQALLERDARGGTRYTEILRAHFGVTSPDARLQRPEYIGGGSTPLQLTPIAQTAPSAGVPLGALGAAGTAAGSHHASFAATEHGYVIGLISVRSELAYQQGIWKMWSRQTRYDFYWPALALLGEQAILRQEIYATGVDADDALVFGYQERWHEYRTRVSEVGGVFRSTTATNIDEWTLAQQFVGAPVLSAGFIEDTPPMARVLAAGALAVNQQYLADILIRRDAVRPLPVFGTPATLGRF